MTPGFTILGPSPRRSFKLTVGLDPGYGPGTGAATETTDKIRFHRLGGVILDWLASQSAAGRPFLNGTLTRGACLYTRPPTAGRVAGRYREEVAVFEGEVSPVHLADVPDEEVEFALLDLAQFLAERFEQTRIYAAYREKTWVVQRGEMPT